MKNLLFLIALYGLQANALTPEDLFLGMEEQSDQVKMFVGEELKYQYPTLKMRQSLLSAKKSAFEILQEDDGDFPDIFESLFKSTARKNNSNRYDPELAAIQIHDYQIKMRNYKAGNLSIGLNRATNGGIVATAALTGAELGTLIAPGLGTAGGAVIGSLAGFVATEVSNGYYGWLQERELTRISHQMAGVLVSAVSKEERYLLENLTPEVLSEINEKYNLQDALNQLEVCDDCTPEFESTLRSEIIKNLTNHSKLNSAKIISLKKSVREVQERLSNHEDEFTRINEEMIVIGNELEDISSSVKGVQDTVEQIQSQIVENQNQINNKLGALTNQVSTNFNAILDNGRAIEENRALILENKKDLNFVKDFVYSKLSPTEKLLALENGAYGKNMIAEKRELLIKQLSFQANVGDFLNGARQVSQIASNLGLELGPLNDVLGYGEAVFDIASGLMSPSPNYLGMAVKVTGLFAGRRDIQGERHAAIMRSLGVINKKLDHVLENQMKLFEGQARIMEGLSQISAQIQDVAITLYDQIELTRLDIRTNRTGIREGLRGAHTACNTFISRLDKALYGTALRRSPLHMRRIHFNTYSDQYKNCKSIVNTLDILGQNREVSVLFAEIFNDTDDEISLGRYLNDHYLPLLNSYLKIAKKENINRDLLLGIQPFVNPVALRNAHEDQETVRLAEKVLNLEHWKDNEGRTLSLIELMKSPLDTKTVLEVSRNVNRLAPYFDIVKEDQFPRFEELVKQEGGGKLSVGYYALSDVQTLMELTLIQKTFLTGQALIPYLYQDLLEGKNIPLIKDLLKNYPKIKDNFIAYFVANRLYDTHNKDFYNGKSFYSNPYERALSIGKERYFRKALGIDNSGAFRIRCDQNKTCFLVLLGNNEEDQFELTSYLDRDGKGLIEIHPQANDLIGMREMTLANLFGYNYESQLKDRNEKLNYRFMLLMSAPEIPMKANSNFEKYYDEIY